MKTALALSAAAVALPLTFAGAPAFALIPGLSDTLTVGPGLGGKVGLGALNEIDENPVDGASTSVNGIPFTDSQGVTGDESIVLIEPGSTNDVSDVVIASINGSTTTGFSLDVLLISDGTVPLLPALGTPLIIPETGAVQDLTSDFQKLFGLNDPNPLPAINVVSDIEGVPEPSTWAMMLVGFAGLGFVGWRARGGHRLAA